MSCADQMKKQPLCAIVLLAFAFVPAGAGACECMRIGDALLAAQHEEAVFRGSVLARVSVLVDDNGKVIDRRDAQTHKSGYVRQIVILRVDQAFKGELPPLITLVTEGTGDCGYPFQVRNDYLVFASPTTIPSMTGLVGGSRAWTTSTCTFTQPARGAADLETALTKKFGTREPLWIAWWDTGR
jgi:hypothetical protein